VGARRSPAVSVTTAPRENLVTYGVASPPVRPPTDEEMEEEAVDAERRRWTRRGGGGCGAVRRPQQKLAARRPGIALATCGGNVSGQQQRNGHDAKKITSTGVVRSVFSR
jgi:hypothetical protein